MVEVGLLMAAQSALSQCFDFLYKFGVFRTEFDEIYFSSSSSSSSIGISRKFTDFMISAARWLRRWLHTWLHT